jgi:hypothetical protein
VDLDGLEAQASINFGVAAGTQGVKATLSVSVDYTISFMTTSYGAALTYHSNFWNTGKSGFELRNSGMLNAAWNQGSPNAGSISFSTNFWNGFGELKEFNQRTGRLKIQQGIFSFAYENDGTPFQLMGLGDGNDSYRTAALTFGVGDFSLKANLFTGLRNKKSYIEEEARAGGKYGLGKTSDGESIKPDEKPCKRIANVNKDPYSVGEFGEKYKMPFVVEQGTPYRFGGLTLNYGGASIGINSDRYVRHSIQNGFAHYIAQPQPMFKVLGNKMTRIANYTTLKQSKYTEWSQDGTGGN